MGRKRGSGKKTVVETGTSNPNDVDYDWLPKETLNHFSKRNLINISFYIKNQVQ